MALSLRPGQRVIPFQPAVAFVPLEERALSGVFRQTAARLFNEGEEVMVAMQSLPLHLLYHTDRCDHLRHSRRYFGWRNGALPTVSQFLGSDVFLVRLAIPDDLPEHAMRLGMSGSAMRIIDNVGPIKPLANILFWMQKMLNYL